MRSFIPSFMRWSCSMLFAFLMFFGLAAGAQTTGSISGTITDSNGAAVKGATVELINTDRNATIIQLTTNNAGYYTGTSLPLGTYSVRISSGGFQTTTVRGLVLHVADALTVNRTLTIGESSQAVTVTADQARVNLEDASSSGLINATQINEMVQSTRNYEKLIELQPGVVFGGASDQLNVGPTSPTGGSNQVSFSINGNRNTANNWTIDGADNVDRGANLTLLTFPSEDSIAEFKTLRGQYSAEFGRSAAGQIDVVTKSGSNPVHLSAYEFIRNDALDANGYYNNFNKLKKTKYRYNDFGGSFGGPVYLPKLYDGRDKTFFFVSLELRRVVTYTSGAALVPTAEERAGDFSNAWSPNAAHTGYVQGPTAVCIAFDPATGNCTQAGTHVTPTSPTVQAYLQDLYSKIPLPQSALDAQNNIDPHTLNSTIPNRFDNTNTVIRVDQQVGQKLRVFYRYLHDTFPTFQGAGTFTTVPIPGISATISHSPGTQHLGRGTYQFSPTLLLDMGYAYSNGSILTVPQGALLSGASPDIAPTLPYTNVLGVIPTLGVSGLSTLGGAGVYNDHDVNHNAFGSLTKVLKNHTLIGGITYNHFQKKENSNAGGNQGSFSFGVSSPNIATVPGSAGTNLAMNSEQAFANFLLGNVTPGSFSQTSNAVTVDIQENIYEAFLQDNWKVTPRLTVNLGVRYSYFGQPIDGQGQLNNFDPAAYSDALAPTIDSTGAICLTAPCVQLSGQGSTTPNLGADYYNTVNYINGLIYAGPNFPNNQKSRFGSKIGATDNTNFAPRIGFAFDVFGDGKTALRGGYGWSYDESEVSYYETQIFNNPPATTTFANASAASIDDPASAAGRGAVISSTPGRLLATPIDYKTPYVQQFSLDVQQALSPTFMLDIGYFGTRGVHLLGLLDINETQPGAYIGKVSPNYSVSGTAGCAYPLYTSTTSPLPTDTYAQYQGTPSFLNSTCGRVLNQIRPYKGYFAIDAVRSIFSSNYNGLQVKATKRFSGKTYLDVNYTWSRAMTNSQNDYSTPPQNTFNINADYGRAALDRTSVLTIDGVYELPWFRDQKGIKGRLIGGWELSGIFALNSGLPLTATASSGLPILYGYASAYNGSWSGGYETDNAGLGILGNTNAALRPDQIGNPNSGNGRQIHTRQEWFYKGAFASPAPGSVVPGNAKRGTINGPGFSRLDAGVFRNFRIYNRLNFQFRAEAYNVANHTNAQTVGTAVTTASSFGQVTNWRDARILQFGGKFVF